MLSEIERQRFESLMVPHLNAVFSFAMVLTRNDSRAQDLTQESYLRAFRYFASYDAGNAKAWLLRITRNTFLKANQNVCLDVVASSFPDDEAMEIEDQSPESRPDLNFIRNEVVREVHMALANLPKNYREIIVLKDIEDLSYKEIGSILELPMGTVMSRLARAREQLRNELEKGRRHEIP